MLRTRKLLKRRGWTIALALLCLFTLTSLLYMGFIWPNALFAASYSVRGLDVSSYQKDIDWATVAQSGEYSFVFIKATEGRTYQDAYFQANWRGTREHGLLRGAYHYYTEYLTGAEQADNYISMVPKEAGMLPPVLDLEVTGKDRAVMLREIRIFLERLEQHYGLKPIIYADHDRYNQYIKGNFDDYPLWIRDVVIPANWTEAKQWTFWQYCSRCHVNGISGWVDLNAFSGDKSKIAGLLRR